MNRIRINALLLKLFLSLIIASPLFHAQNLCAGTYQSVQTEDYTLIFDAPIGLAFKDVMTIYPETTAELERIFGWQFRLKPSILLIGETQKFRNMAESPLTVAFAVPARNLIVIDFDRANKKPFSLKLTLKHELCHLLLHQYIKTPLLPRWLDEGVAQWTSDGLIDIMVNQKRSLLNRAALRRTFIPLHALERGFPGSNDALILAYEQSKSLITYIIGRYGTKGVLDILYHMEAGKDVATAVPEALSVTLQELEQDWHRSLRRKITWFTFLSYHLYEILFGLMAIITAIAFVRVIIKKRNYPDEEPDDMPVYH